MTTILAQPDFTENTWLDGFQFHFGEWIRQIVAWTDQNLGWLLSIIKWPFQTLFDIVLNDDPTQTGVGDIPWFWVAIAFFVIGSIARTTRVGIMSGIMVAVCGMLGPDYWSVTAETFAMVFVSVLLCVLIGVPLGIACGRIDAVWNVTRPTLDAMQVIHPFVFMLPFIFFWQVGQVSATMVTMVFALPPLVRLTNLGIRQVPEDVVEASRSFGATEARVLTDVQLPLARPAIMTGLNQTLLLTMTMLGIAALMGAGGLGTLLLRALSSQNQSQAASGGLAFFLVAVVLDRISQREHDDGLSLFTRLREALAYRSDPSGLLEVEQERKDEVTAKRLIESVEDSGERPAPVSQRERLGLMLAVGGAVVAMVAAFLPWGKNAGLVSAWGRRVDEIGLLGQTFSGIEASGGSIFGVIVLGLSFIGFMAALRPLIHLGAGTSRFLKRVQGVMFVGLGVFVFVIWLLNMLSQGFGPLPTIGLAMFGIAFVALTLDTWVEGTPRLGADGALITLLGAFAAAIGYLVLQPSGFVETYSHGIGVFIAVAATAVAALGAGIAMFAAPYAPYRPLKLAISWPLIAGAAFGILMIFIGSYSAWLVDERLDSLITPEMQAEIDRLTEEAEGDVGKQISNGQTITNMINSAQSGDAPMFTGYGSDGPRLGWPLLGFGGFASLAALFAAGLFGGAETRRWRSGSIAAGLGLATVVIPAAWIFSFTRSGEPSAITGAGAFFALVGGFVLFVVGRGMVGEFRRRKIYDDVASAAAGPVVIDANDDLSDLDVAKEAFVIR